jgi:hypothetical protein
MKKILLTNGGFALVDDEDYERVMQYDWHVTKVGVRCNSRILERRLANFILDVSEELDHADRNILNNRRCNLRLCTRSQNNMNRTKMAGSASSRYKGVSWDSWNKAWRAQVFAKSKRVHVSRHKTEVDAAKAYDEAAKEFHGEFAKTNFA